MESFLFGLIPFTENDSQDSGVGGSS